MLGIKRFVIVFGMLLVLFMFLLNSSFSVNAFAKETEDCKSYILIESNSKEILKEHNKEEKLPIASVTKLMTILLALEKIENKELDLQKTVICSEKASSMGGSQVFLESGGEYKVKDLLKATIIASANDASVLLAEEISGSEEEFCKRMNEKALELGLKNTNYINSTGLPAPMQYSSAEDVACVFSEVIKYPLYFELSSIWMDDFLHPNNRVTNMANTNKLLKTFSGCDGGKTGSTGEAGYCLASTAKRGDMRLSCVVLGAKSSKDRFSKSAELLEYGFKNFEVQKIVDKSINLADDLKIEKAQENDLQVFAEEDFCVVTKKGDNTKYTTIIDLPQTITAPLKEGDVVGKIDIFKDNEKIKEINIVVNNDLDEISWFMVTKKILEKWSI